MKVQKYIGLMELEPVLREFEFEDAEFKLTKKSFKKGWDKPKEYKDINDDELYDIKHGFNIYDIFEIDGEMFIYGGSIYDAAKIVFSKEDQFIDREYREGDENE